MINAAFDARLALNERITNNYDATPEMHARLKYGIDVAGMAADDDSSTGGHRAARCADRRCR